MRAVVIVVLSLLAGLPSSQAKRRAVRHPSPDPIVVQYRGDASRSGITREAGPATLGAVRWRRALDGPVRGLVYDRGIVYAGAANGVFALDAISGEERWTFRHDGVQFSPVAIDGDIVLAAARNVLYALHRTNGSIRWQFDAGASITSSTPLLVDGIAYAGSAAGTLHAIDIASGVERWRRPSGSGVRTHLTAAGTTLIAVTQGALRAFSLTDGGPLWTRTLPDGADWTEAAAAGDRVFAGAEGNDFYALDAATGATLWMHDDTNSDRSGWSAPVVTDGMVIAGNRNRRVFAFDPLTGRVLWRFDTAEAATSDATLSAGTLYFGVGAHGFTDEHASLPLYAVRAADGGLVSTFTVTGHVLGGAAVGGSALYGHTSAGEILAVQ